VKGDWGSGLQHLLSCSDRDLVELARQDTTQPRTLDEIVKLADAWYAWGREANQGAKQGAWFRALTWYRRASPFLPEPATQQIEQRIAEMAAVMGDAGLVPTIRFPWLDIPPGEVRSFEGHQANVTALAVAPSGVRLASAAEDRTVRMWNLLTGEQIWKQETKTSQLSGVVITPDSQFVFSNFDDQQFAEMQARDGRVSRYVGHSPTSPIGLCLTPDGLLIWAARCPPPNLIVWGLAQHRLVGQYGDGDYPNVLDLSQDGRRIATGDARGVVRVWDTRTGDSLCKIVAHQDAVTDLDFSSDGQRVATVSRHEIRILEIPSPEPVRAFRVEAVHAVAFSPDGRRLASGGAREEILLWDVSTGRRYETNRAAAALTDRDITCIAFLPDSRGLVTGATGGKIRLWRLAD
jgi:WD40 repeat protein